VRFLLLLKHLSVKEKKKLPSVGDESETDEFDDDDVDCDNESGLINFIMLFIQ